MTKIYFTENTYIKYINRKETSLAMTVAVDNTKFSRLAESLLTEIGKLDNPLQDAKRQAAPAKEEKHPVHNSLQHDPAVSAPLLTMLVDALKKDASENTKEGLEIIADEGEKKVDAVVALAERIKRMYANEMMQSAYMNAAQSNYNPLAHYSKPSAVKLPAATELNAQEGYDEAKKLEPKAVADESSIGYKLSKGDKYQAFIMTDPKGRIHSSWEIVRILNESYDGMIERNDGLHGQWLS